MDKKTTEDILSELKQKEDRDRLEKERILDKVLNSLSIDIESAVELDQNLILETLEKQKFSLGDRLTGVSEISRKKKELEIERKKKNLENQQQVIVSKSSPISKKKEETERKKCHYFYNQLFCCFWI
jgi:hypothetical protein